MHMIYIYIKLFLFWGISEALPYSWMSEKENNQPKYLPQRYCKKKPAIQLPSSYLSDWIMGPLQIWKSMSSPHQDHKRSHILYSTRVSWGGFHLGIHPPGSKKILTTSVRELLWCPISSCGAHHWKRTGAALLSLWESSLLRTILTVMSSPEWGVHISSNSFSLHDPTWSWYLNVANSITKTSPI